MRLRLAKFIFK